VTRPTDYGTSQEREFFIDNLLIRIHFIIAKGPLNFRLEGSKEEDEKTTLLSGGEQSIVVEVS